MLKNYFKIAWRNITRHKTYTVINVLGLALGICACLVIYLITSFDFSFDRFHPDKERIYRIVGEFQPASGEKRFMNSPMDDVAGFQKQIPGFEAAAGFHLDGEEVNIPDGDRPAKKFSGRIEKEGTWSAAIILTGPQYFDIFHYQWLVGNAQASLSEPYKVVLSENKARKYFGNIPLEKIIGKPVIYDDSLRVSVAGIVKDWTGNTDFGFTDFISISTAPHSFLKRQIPTEDWSSLSPHRSMAFVKLAKGTTPEQINTRFDKFIKDHVKFHNTGSKLTMYLQPLSDIHFTKDFHRGDDGDNFRKPFLPTLYALMGVALFILVIACVNFINLSTSQSIQRAKEIGVRKVLGSTKSNITSQFLSETFVVTLMATMLSIILVNPVLYLFRSYLPAGVNFQLSTPATLLFLFAIVLLTSLLSGFYPAKVMASYLPALSLKGSVVQQGTGKVNLRKALIIFQFTISLVFIIASLVIANQINFMNKADKGFNTDAIITINNWNDHEGKMKVLAEKIKHLTGISKVIQQGNPPMGFAQNMDNFKFKPQGENIMEVSAQIGNEDFIPFYQMKLIAGRNMQHSDSLTELVINETLAKNLGFNTPQEAVGKTLFQVGYQSEKPYPIVGVVADFHEGSFQEAIRPAVIENVVERKFSVAIKLAAGEKNTGAVKTVISNIETEWKKIFPEAPFQYSLLNESISWLYGQEEKTAWLMNVATIITIFISCMGIFGLGMFTAQRRTKEIGIRKVLGANVTDITALLSKDFLKLVIVAIVIASPIAWYFMNQWLLDYSYRTNISWWVFALAGLSAIIISLLTVSFQSIKAAIANPVKSLRTE
jgi:putative ABC transport system permease protein